MIADGWHLKNINLGTPRLAIMTVQAQSSLLSVKLGISSNPKELNRAVDEKVYTFYFKRK